MDLIFARSPILLAFLIALAAFFVWWAYGRMTPRPGPPRKILLGGLRFAALGLLLFLLFEPIVRLLTVQEEAPVVAVLLDDTRSLAPDDSLVGGAGLLSALEELRLPGAEVRYFRFAGDVQPIDNPSELTFNGPRTDLASALQHVEDRLEGRNLRGVVLISDGRYNTGRNPLYLADRFGAPIFTVTVGDTARVRDVRISDVVSNEIAYAGVQLPVRVSILNDGYEGEQATVTISEGGTVMAQTSLTLPAGGIEATTELTITPEEEGVRRYTVSVTQFEGEATHANNRSSLSVRVLSSRRSVLLLAAAPGPDVSSIRQELERDANVQVTTRVPRPDGRYYEGDFPARLSDYDLVVLAGFPGPTVPAAHAEAVAQAIGEGLPALFQLTRQTDLARYAQTLAGVLPARPETARPAFIEAHLDPTSAGAAHPVLSVPGAPPAALNRLPPILANESRWLAAPDARILATTEVRGIALDDPLLVVHQRGRNRSAALLATGLWRWSNLPPDLEDLAGFYPGLVENLVRWLTAREDDRPLRVRSTQDLFDTTEPVRFTGQLYDESLEPVSNADVQVTIVGADGAELPFPMRPLGNGRYSLEARTLPAGEYRYRARAERGSAELGTDLGSFAVGTLDLEMRDLTADPSLMAELSRRTGGEATFPDQMATLNATLTDRLVTRPVSTSRDTELWRLAPLLFLLVGLLSAEWVLRKRSGMV